ncbi:hypothetical protein XENOCAPTIV_005948, partial [Xenoophorus captivus]
ATLLQSGTQLLPSFSMSMVSYDQTINLKCSCDWMPNGMTATLTRSGERVGPLSALVVTKQNAKEIAERKAGVFIL